MTSQWWSDDDQLLAAVGNALSEGRDVPAGFVEAGRAAWEWRDIDAELAALTFDSALDERALPALTRAEPATLRTLTFSSPRLTIELEVTDDALLGQLVPPQPGELEVHTADSRATAGIDEHGYFVVQPVPPSPFRLSFRIGEATVLTGWITL